MEINYIILDSYSAAELELLLDEKALDGYKAISMTSCYEPGKEILYAALMVNYGINNQLEDAVAQISEKLDSISTTLHFIEANTGNGI